MENKKDTTQDHSKKRRKKKKSQPNSQDTNKSVPSLLDNGDSDKLSLNASNNCGASKTDLDLNLVPVPTSPTPIAVSCKETSANIISPVASSVKSLPQRPSNISVQNLNLGSQASTGLANVQTNTAESTKKKTVNKLNSSPVKTKGDSASGLGSSSSGATFRNQTSTTPLFQWSRKENNLNLAVEENHNNLIVETNSLQQESYSGLTASATNTVHERNKPNPPMTTPPMTTCSKDNSEATAGKSRAKTKIHPKGEAKNIPVSIGVDCAGVNSLPASTKDSSTAAGAGAVDNLVTQSVGSTDVPQGKSKAQLKAERKAAFEAQKAADISAQKEVKQTKSKAERRALQEAQRALKATPGDGTVQTQQADPLLKKEISKPSVGVKVATEPLGKQSKEILPRLKAKKLAISPDKQIKNIHRKLRLFSHLPQHVWNPKSTSKLGMSGIDLHPSVIRTGLQMAQGFVRGSNARCVASLIALRDVIKDYVTPPQKELSRELDAIITSHVKFLKDCRPLAASTANAVKRLKWEVTQIDSSFDDAKAKEKLNQVIDTFIEEDILLAKDAISLIAGKKITNGDVILTYACSSLVKQLLSDAHNKGKKFTVIVVDSRPGLEGCEMLRYLVSQGISCTYVWINAVSYVIKEVTKVILGCHSLQANGYVMSRVGSSQVALVAHANNVPVLVCCETYKFCERVHTDSFICNELGNPDKLVDSTPVHKTHLGNLKDLPFLSVVSLTYDVMPAHLVTCVITELEMLPCTSVPVVLRVKHVTTQEFNDKLRPVYG